MVMLQQTIHFMNADLQRCLLVLPLKRIRRANDRFSGDICTKTMQLGIIVVNTKMPLANTLWAPPDKTASFVTDTHVTSSMPLPQLLVANANIVVSLTLHNSSHSQR